MEARMKAKGFAMMAAFGGMGFALVVGWLP